MKEKHGCGVGTVGSWGAPHGRKAQKMTGGTEEGCKTQGNNGVSHKKQNNPDMVTCWPTSREYVNEGKVTGRTATLAREGHKYKALTPTIEVNGVLAMRPSRREPSKATGTDSSGQLWR